MLKYCLVFSLLFILAGCGPPPPRLNDTWQVKADGIEHAVEEGETLWSIARLYDVKSIDIYQNNEIKDVTRLESGSTLFIPGAREAKTAPREEEKVDAEATAKRLQRRAPIQSEEFFVRPFIGPLIRDVEKSPEDKNNGVDLHGMAGSEVLAAKSGVVIAAQSVGEMGNVVIIDHGSAERTFYGYLRSISVFRGQTVRQGDMIGRIGTSPRTGRSALHFRIYRDGEPIDPIGRFSL